MLCPPFDNVNHKVVVEEEDGDDDDEETYHSKLK
jgi:hypothetical protein